MTTPEPTPADRAAAAAFTLASGEWIQEDLLAEHFAAWRVKERERLKALAESVGKRFKVGGCFALYEFLDELDEELLTPEANNDQ